jgi:hypothetical protein
MPCHFYPPLAEDKRVCTCGRLVVSAGLHARVVELGLAAPSLRPTGTTSANDWFPAGQSKRDVSAKVDDHILLDWMLLDYQVGETQQRSFDDHPSLKSLVVGGVILVTAPLDQQNTLLVQPHLGAVVLGSIGESPPWLTLAGDGRRLQGVSLAVEGSPPSLERRPARSIVVVTLHCAGQCW